MPLFNGPIIGRLGSILRNAGGGLLRDAIVQRLPGSEEIVDAIAGRLGIESRPTPDETAAVIVAEYEARPEAVEEAATVVATEQMDRWAVALTAVAVAAQAREQTMQNEANSAYWPVRYWRPIFAIIAAVSFPVSIVLLFILLRSPLEGVPNPFEAATIFAGFCVVVLPVALGVLGVYVGARSFEKGRGAA